MIRSSDIDFEQMSKDTGISVEELKDSAAEFNKFLDEFEDMPPEEIEKRMTKLIETLDKLTDIYMDNVSKLLSKEAGLAALTDISVVVGVGALNKVAFDNWIGDPRTAATVAANICERAKEVSDGQGMDDTSSEEQV